MPVVWPPDTTLADVRAAATELLPGARLRRLLFFRYALRWTRPPKPHPPTTTPG